MLFEIKSRWSGKVQITAEIECSADASIGVKMGLAVRWAYKNGANLRGANLSRADLSRAVLSGADLSDAVLSGAVLRDANLSGAVLSRAVLSGANLRDAVLSGADLRDANLSGAILSRADLSRAVLSDAVLSGAVLSGANLSGAPVIPDIHKAVFAAASPTGALDMSQWHDACGTAHCRAGWVVTLAGDAGKALENWIGTAAAATLIYLASDPTLDRVPDFYCSDAHALSDMKSLAEKST